jgi:hypothetical protein
MSDMPDCSYKKGSVSGNGVNNDYLNLITGFCGFDSSDDKHGQDDGFPQYVSYNLSSLSKNLQVLSEQLKFWSSKFIVCRRPLAQPRGSTTRKERAVFR